jgi:MFS family permease
MLPRLRNLIGSGDDNGDSFKTTVLINAASVLEKCDEQILPALYSRVGASLNASPTQLGYITLARAFVQALTSSLAGFASEFFPRGTVIGIGCCIWAFFTSAFACVSSLNLGIMLCAVNGLGLALVIPSVQSLTADLHSSEARGRAFGSLWLVISLGGMIGALYATNMGSHTPFGIDGWRFVFLSVSLVSAVTGVLNHMYVKDDAFEDRARQREEHEQGQSTPTRHSLSSDDGSIVSRIKTVSFQIVHVMKIPTFSLIILQGIVGSVPYASLVFLTLYLQLLGMSDTSASVIVALYLIGGGLGGLLGGWIGDIVASRYPNHGRILATQFSVFIGIPFSLLVFKALPDGGSSIFVVTLYAMTIFIFAVLTAWPAPCANNPIFSEIVPPAQRNLVYSFDRCFEGAVAAFATPLVGHMSETMFGFSGASTVSGDPDTDLPNAHALGNALVAFTTIPWLFCFVVYSSIHVTYPKDKRTHMYDTNWSHKKNTPQVSHQGLARLSSRDDDDNAALLQHTNHV